ncbi:MAG TPA: HEXXH motif domain-containing protein [Pseudonocardiaceae bacterium]|nr:HEXXH motif domain-containing protein [Pseudonocardiaceae bacterium]
MSESTEAAGLRRYRLPVAQFDALSASTFDNGAFDALRSAERSRRLLLLHLIMEHGRRDPELAGPLAPADDAWALLARVDENAPDVVDLVLTRPQTGMWMGHTLRRLRGITSDRAPIWFHVGQLHALAVAAAIRAGLSCSLTVPVREGVVMLPTLGCVTSSDDAQWAHTDVAAEPGEVRVRGRDGWINVDPWSMTPSGTWLPLRSLRGVADGRTLTVELDDVSIFRGLDSPTRPKPLSDDDVDRWRTTLNDAWSLLVRHHRRWADELAFGLTTLVPIPVRRGYDSSSSSVDDGVGAAILTEPHDAAHFAVAVVHEFQHSILNSLRHIVSLTQGEETFTEYAPWRDDPRPVGALVHGVFAFTAIAEFWATQHRIVTGSAARLALFECALWRHQTTKAVRSLRHRPELTGEGARLLATVTTRLDRLAEHAIPADVLAAAEAAASDHFAAWRTCYLVPDADRVRAIADAWSARRPAPYIGDVGTEVTTERTPHRLDTKAMLMRLRIGEPALFDSLRGDPDRLADRVSGASSADIAYVAGDWNTAHTGYRTELAARAARPGDWSGLGLTLAASGRHGAADVLMHQPELVRAVHAAVAETTGTAPSVDDLADWLAGGRRVTTASGRCHSSPAT